MKKNVKCNHPYIKTLNSGEILIFIINGVHIKATFKSKETNLYSLAYPDKNLHFITLNQTYNRNLWTNNELTSTIHDKITNVYRYIPIKDKLNII